jgi:hypothetical protein
MQGDIQFPVRICRFLCHPGYLSQVIANWGKVDSGIHILNHHPGCKIKFSSSFVLIFKDDLLLFLNCRTTSPFPIRFNSLAVCFNNPNYNSLCVVSVPGSSNSDVSDEGDLYLEPKKIKKITFIFTPFPEDVSKHIEVGALTPVLVIILSGQSYVESDPKFESNIFQ